jgi:DNA-directed RNA polymerase
MTEALKATQLALENEAMGLGIQSYYKHKADAEGSESTLPPGLQLIKASIEPTALVIDKFIEDGLAGMASRSVGVVRFMDQFPDRNMLAYITAQAVFNHMGRQATIQAASLAVAVALEDCLNFDDMKKSEPALYKQLIKKLEHSKDSRHRHIVLRVQQKYAGIKPITWGLPEKMRLGSTLIHLFAQATGLVQITKYHRGVNDTPEILEPTEETLKWLEEAHARCAMLTPPWMPMVVKPLRWNGPYGGGYLTKQLRFPLIKKANRNYLDDLKQHEMPLVLEALNALQETPWSINKGILNVMREVWDGGGRLGKLPSRDKTELPPKTFNEENPDPEELKAWKKKAAVVYEENIRMRSKRVGMSSKLWLGEKFAEFEEFYFVHNLDWRGRAYPMATFLNPQGGDADKALLQFARSVPLGEHGARWLAIHGANTFGVDKVSFDSRADWVEEHHDQILECALNPLDGSRWWADADSPYMFLAFCYEWLALSLHVNAGGEQEKFLSSLPCSWDGTCNGLQNFSALLRDEVGGAVVGLVPTDKPCDIYTAVAQASDALITTDAAQGVELGIKWKGKMSRKLAKPNTMTVPYGATPRGMADQIDGVFRKMANEAQQAGQPLDFQFNMFDSQYIAKKNYEAIGNVVVAARLAMDWLREAAKVVASDGLPIRWVTPSGLLVLQDYREFLGKRLDFDVAGKRCQMMLKLEGDKLDRRKQSAGISPNFVHSLDAAHMMRTVSYCLHEGVTDFAMIHDSYGTHAGNAETLRYQLRRAFVDQYSAPVLEDFRNQMVDQLTPELAAKVPPLPPMGNLDLEQVMHSEYFFA